MQNPPSDFAAAADAAGDEQAVRAALQAWKAAMIAKDRAAFERLYHPNIVYAHSTGQREDKARAIDNVVGGRSSWEAVNLEDTQVKVSGATAVVTGKVEYHQRTGDVLAIVPLFVMTVWSKGTAGWQMLGRQASKLPVTP